MALRAEQQEHSPSAIAPSVRRFSSIIRLLTANNFPMVNPGYRDLLQAAQTGQPLPDNHPARRLPIL